jgi:hypothetical protein
MPPKKYALPDAVVAAARTILSHVEEGSPSESSRSGTIARPHARKRDSKQTRSSTFHLTVDLFRELRLESVHRNTTMSLIVEDAVTEWLSRNKS